MAEKDEVRAAIMKVAGDWARYIDTKEPQYRKATRIRLLKRYRIICERLQEIHGIHFQI